MANSGFFQGEKKKLKKSNMEKRAQKPVSDYTIPQVEIIGKKKKSW